MAPRPSDEPSAVAEPSEAVRKARDACRDGEGASPPRTARRGSSDRSDEAERLLAEARDPLFVSPPVDLAMAIARSVRTGDAEARLLLPVEDATALFEEFRAATAAAQAVAEGRLAVRTADRLSESVTIGEEGVWAHLWVNGTLRSLSTTDSAATGTLRDAFERRWDDATDYEPTVPARDVLLDSFAERWPDAGDALAEALAGAGAVRRRDALDPVGVCTLVGARYELFSLELGEWAREVDFSSRTEVARAKERLSDAGVVETRRVPRGVGRPRQQLALADPEHASMSPVDLVSVARERLTLAASRE